MSENEADPVAFLRSRLDEDERAATSALAVSRRHRFALWVRCAARRRRA